MALIFDEDVIVAERLGRCTRERETTVLSLGYVRSVNRAWRSTERSTKRGGQQSVAVNRAWCQQSVANRAWRQQRGANRARRLRLSGKKFSNWFLPP